MSDEKRKLARRHFSYYMRIIDEVNGQLVGHLIDISTGGFKLDSSKAIPLNKDFRLRIDLTGDVSQKTSMVFNARSRWCQTDDIDPSSFNVGFQVTNMSPSDYEIFNRIFEKYGSQGNSPRKSNSDYMWR